MLEVVSRIDRVVVHPGAAMVTRIASATLTASDEVAFVGLPAGLDEDSLEVEVADLEPGGTAEPADLIEEAPRVALAAPALRLRNDAREGVHDGVQVGADLQSVQPDVIRGVADHGDLIIREGGPQALQEPGATHAARQRPSR